MQVTSKSVNRTLKIGRLVAKSLKRGDILCLFGQLGAGKTVFTKGIAAGLGIKKENIISPSFVLIREYPEAKLPFYHFDLYRLKEQKQILFLGYEEYLYGDGVSVIEWADRLGRLLPLEFLKIELLIKDVKERRIKFTSFGSRYQELLEKISENLSR
ncbi:MAG: tRNA (adenosine(37)-N6)-threonylcarbamoyltransferase complex ATPase subunit type 1 TsaE [Candidatus Omnitrophota bacterium]|jgi:tRNA threonylcarbamoyladenosine biosynthesis protein TsaE